MRHLTTMTLYPGKNGDTPVRSFYACANRLMFRTTALAAGEMQSFFHIHTKVEEPVKGNVRITGLYAADRKNPGTVPII